jgi:hypothetical protein
MTILRNWFNKEGAIAYLIAGCCLLATILVAAAAPIGVGFAESTTAKGFLQKPNWYLFPLFLPPVAWLVFVTWHRYINAWKGLRATCVLHTPNYRRIKEESLAKLLRKLVQARVVALTFSLAIGIGLSVLDSRTAFDFFQNPGLLQQSCAERDFTVAILLPKEFPRAHWFGNLWFDCAAYLCQSVLISLAFLSLFQVLIHTFWFGFIERTKLGKEQKVMVDLMVDDPLYEFGMTEWNHAINIGYVFVAVAMAVPTLSHFSQLAACKLDLGQHLLGLTGTLLIAPAVLPTLARFWRIRQANALVQSIGTEELRNLYDKQKIWPFDRFHIGKIMLAVAFMQYLIVTGHGDWAVDLVKKLVEKIFG